VTASRTERRKLNVILFGMCALFVTLGGRLYYIQALCHEPHRRRAESQTQLKIDLPARRGSILDRNGRWLVLSVPAYTVAASLGDVRDAVSTAQTLAAVLEMSEDELLTRLQRRVQFVYLKRKVSVEAVKKIREMIAAEREAGGARHLRGIHLLPDSRRTYVCGRSAAHLLGFTRWYPKEGDSGQEGVERALDAVLRGKPGRWLLRRDGRRRAFGTADEEQQPAIQGHSVVLSMDLSIQNVLEDQLEDIAAEYRPRSACGVVIDPRNGKVLAMASWPNFDPNAPGKCVRGARLNRTLTTVSEPGSTMKPLVAAAALESGTARPTTRVYCEKGAWSPRRGRTITDSHAYGWLSLANTVIKSSNIGMAKVGRKLGARRLNYYCRAFGFGRRTGLGLPGESRGILRPVSAWTGDSVLSIPFGHEISVTPLQLATAYAAIANGGVLYRPQMLERIEDAEGQIVQNFPPVAVRRVISRKTSAQMREILKGVVERGTGRRAQLKGWTVCGKTGTARKLVNGRYSDRKHYASFVGFAPAEAPRLVALITVDEPHGAYYGGVVAAPRVAKLLARGLAHLGVPKRGNSKLAAARRTRTSRTRATRRR
jgi:cell division protein FtsI (penicillin-binding protein 3)